MPSEQKSAEPGGIAAPSGEDHTRETGTETRPEFTSVPIPESERTAPYEDLYANGAEIGCTLSDMNVLFSINGRPKCRVHMSFTTAKTLAASLTGAIDAFENLTEHSIMTMDEVDKGLTKGVSSA